MTFIIFLDENLYRKKERALRKYFMKCYKYLIFEFFPTLKKSGKKDGIYEVELPIDKAFELVYGKLLIKFTIKNDIAIIEDIIPSKILIDCYEQELPTYKGIPYKTRKDLKKIKLAKEILKND